MSSIEAHGGPGGFAGGFAADVAAAARLAEAQLQRPVMLRAVCDGQATATITNPGRRGRELF